MVSQIKNGINTMLLNMKNFGTASMEAGNAAFKSISQKVNDSTKETWVKLGEQLAFLAPAKNAAYKVADKMKGAVLKTAARTYIRFHASDSVIQKLRTELKDVTFTDNLAERIHHLVPELVAKGQLMLPEDSHYRFLLSSDKESCGKILEAKILETLIQIAKKTETRRGEGEEHLILGLMEKLVTATDDNISKKDGSSLKEELKRIGAWFMSKESDKIKAAINDLLLSGESLKNPELVKEIKDVAEELLKGLGLDVSKDASFAESLLMGIAKQALGDSASKILFHLKEKLNTIDEKIGDKGSAPANDFFGFGKIAKDLAGEFTNTLFENLLGAEAPGEASAEPIKKQKTFIESMLEKMFNFIFNSLFGSVLSDLLLNIPLLGKVFKVFSSLSTKLKEVQKEENEKMREKRLEDLYEEAIEELVGDSLADWLINNISMFKKGE